MERRKSEYVGLYPWEVTITYRVGLALCQTPWPAVPVRLHPPGPTRKEKAAKLSPARTRGEPRLHQMSCCWWGTSTARSLPPSRSMGVTMVGRGPAWWREAARAMLKKWGGERLSVSHSLNKEFLYAPYNSNTVFTLLGRILQAPSTEKVLNK